MSSRIQCISTTTFEPQRNSTGATDAHPEIVAYETASLAVEPPEDLERATSASPLELSALAPLPVAEDLRVPWGWRDIFFLCSSGIAGTVVVTLFLAVIFQSRGVSWSQLREPGAQQGIFLVSGPGRDFVSDPRLSRGSGKVSFQRAVLAHGGLASP